MALSRPTLGELRARIIGDLSGRTAGKAFLRRSIERVLGSVVAGVAHGLYGAIEWAEQQQLPATAEEEALVRWGALLRVPRIAGTNAAAGIVSIDAAPGTIVEAGTRLRTDQGVLLYVTERTTITGTSGPLPVAAVETGAAGNVGVGELVSVVSPVAGLSPRGEVTTELVGGAGLEDLEAYRARVVAALRQPPRNGGPGDYRAWALEVPGVSEAWEYAHREGVGTVTIAITTAEATRIPSAALVSDVQQYIDARRPLDVRAVYVRAPIARPVDISLTLSPATFAARDEVVAALEQLFAETAPGVAVSRSVLDEAISLAPSERAHEVTLISSLVPAPLELLTLGTVTVAGVP